MLILAPIPEPSPSHSRRSSSQHSQVNIGLPPLPAPLDPLRPFRRELERIASPTPNVDWTGHDRHERIFSPIPFSTRTRAPSVERVIFTPINRPFTPVVLGTEQQTSTSHPPVRAQVAIRSSSIVNDRFEPRDTPSGPTGVDGKCLCCPPRLVLLHSSPF